MTQEEKQLLLQDLCARLPYGVICDRLGQAKKLLSVSPYKVYCLEFDNGEYMPCGYKVEDVKPYLRPMSSMTEKEREQLYFAIDFYGKIDKDGDIDASHHDFVFSETCMDYIDWLNAHHFDFRNLIERGLAIDCTNLNIY